MAQLSEAKIKAELQNIIANAVGRVRKDGLPWDEAQLALATYLVKMIEMGEFNE